MGPCTLLPLFSLLSYILEHDQSMKNQATDTNMKNTKICHLQVKMETYYDNMNFVVGVCLRYFTSVLWKSNQQDNLNALEASRPTH